MTQASDSEMDGLIVVYHPDDEAWVLGERAAGRLMPDAPMYPDSACQRRKVYIFDPRLTRLTSEIPRLSMIVDHADLIKVKYVFDQSMRISVNNPRAPRID